jgi:membrane protein YdbS with pleckstrin-like domain
VIGKVIKPPVEVVASGRLFKPSRAFLYKLWVKSLAVAIIFWGFTMGFFFMMAYGLATDPGTYGSASQIIAEWFWPVNNWTVVVNLFWLIPYVALAPTYVRSIEYSVKSESGETMPEIYVKKGIITVTRKHVPFRTITNIESQAGPFDRLFMIGNVSVQTAGYSGNQQTGPEEKLEGVVFYEEVRDFILNELRRYRAPYTVAESTRMTSTDESGGGDILSVLQEIRDLLKDRQDAISSAKIGAH